MKFTKLIVLGSLLYTFFGILPAYSSDNYTVETLPPAVVKTAPVSGELAVDFKIKEIKVTFSKDMQTNNMWSWVMVSKDTFPKIAGKVKFIDKRTCILPVSLEAHKNYVIWINSKNMANFRDINNNPAVPYLLTFKTK